MPITWPAQFQTYVNQDSFTYAIGDSLLRSSNDIGPDKVRRVTTRPVDTITFSITVPFENYMAFATFYNVTLNGGASEFQFAHPFTRTLITIRFSKPPVLTPIGGLYFNVVLEAEVL